MSAAGTLAERRRLGGWSAGLWPASSRAIENRVLLGQTRPVQRSSQLERRLTAGRRPAYQPPGRRRSSRAAPCRASPTLERLADPEAGAEALLDVVEVGATGKIPVQFQAECDQADAVADGGSSIFQLPILEEIEF